MARGKQRGGGRGGRGRGSSGRGKRRGDFKGGDSISKRQKSDLQQFGEVHPADEKEKSYRYKRVEDTNKQTDEIVADISSSDESEVEEQQAYRELLSTFKGAPGQSSKDVEDYEEDDEYESENEGEASNIASDREDDENDEELSSDGEVSKDQTVKTVDDDEEDSSMKQDDPFCINFESEVEESLAEERLQKKPWNKEELRVPLIGKAIAYSSTKSTKGPVSYQTKDLRALHVKQSLCNQVKAANEKYAKPTLSSSEALSPFQQSLFCHLNTYQDFSYSDRTHVNAEEVRLTYCLHLLNHILKTRSRVISHNSKLKAKESTSLEDFRDQGLTRPKVLIILPFRDAALKVVKMLTRLLMSEEQTFVSSKKRFTGEYSVDEDIKKGLKPADFESTFEGNIDDHFRIGISVAKKSLKLYTDFYNADIILASPLGMRTIIGAEGETDRDFDFLSSIELLIFDQVDAFLMQNWDHIGHLMNHMHQQPRESHGVDFSRVRMWTLNGWSSIYRQTLMFGSIVSPEINSIFNKYCHNYRGKVQVLKAVTKGTICQIVTQLPQVFHRVSVDRLSEAADTRFDFFKNKILPEHKDPLMFQTLVFVSSYFDFVRLRNYFLKEGLDMVHISEYSKDKHVTRSRGLFYHGKIHFMLYTERFHFFRRYKIRGIKHVVFYDMPSYPQFYSEICNMLQDSKDKQSSKDLTCAVIYTKYDVNKLAGIVGTDRAAHMVNTDKTVHMFVTGEDS